MTKEVSVWIIEMLNTSYRTVAPRFEPTVGAALTKKDAREILIDWKAKNPVDKFRLKRYSYVKEK